MAESSHWFNDQKYQDYWQQMNLIQRQSSEQAQINEQYSAAHWRSIAQGLHHENQMLHQLVQQLLGMSVQKVEEQQFVPVREEAVKSEHKEEIKSDMEDKAVNFDNITKGNEDYVYDVKTEGEDTIEEYLKFVLETENHKERRDREKQVEMGTETKKKFNPVDEVVTDDILARADDIATDFERLKKEMSDLYGKDALKVHSLETQAQLHFDQWSDTSRPLLWPAMPLNFRRGV
eukprot:GFUD01000195.1.p1 GENE.GFUD01000195.1~~GFUD01000195.1.p1  ORF type:complete len:233 (-),score=71.29 GFUD01000195.1:129-827(-)